MSSVRLEPLYSRHETFSPRFGWFKKSFDGVVGDPSVFGREDATLKLGVGKNMVRSMRFWSGAAELISPRRPVRGERLRPTKFARIFFQDQGWDPYLELPATVWMLHWRFFAPGCQLPVWWYAIHDYQPVNFTIDGLAADAVKGIPAVYNLREPSFNSVRRDVECLVHTYARRLEGRTNPEDMFACPFRGLGLIEAEPGQPGAYRFRIGMKPTLPPAIVLFTALDFAARWNASARSISLARLASDVGSPGRVFKLDEDSLLQALVSGAQSSEQIRVSDTAGVSAVQFDVNPEDLASQVLIEYYASVTGSRLTLTELAAEPELFSAARGATSKKTTKAVERGHTET